MTIHTSSAENADTNPKLWLDVIWMEKFIGEHDAFPKKSF